MYRHDGGIVDAELIRPRTWIDSHAIQAGRLLPMNIEELGVHGSALVTAIDDCPEIADGEGSVVTARFCTRQVHTLAQVTVARPSRFWLDALESQGPNLQNYTAQELDQLAALGLVELETLSGTPIHPVWSEDRHDWVPLGELEAGETLQGADGPATVLSVTILNRPVPVYNIEIHGQHVYQVGELGLVVHNACPVQNGIEMHHLLPQAKQLRSFFDRAGLNVENFKIPIDVAKHRLKPNGVHTVGGGNWNRVWRDFFAANPNATKAQILEQLALMRKQFGI